MGSTKMFIIVGALTLLVIGVGVTIIGQWLRWVLLRRRGRVPPGPFPLPILGNLPHLFASPFLHKSLAGLCEHYGPLVFLHLGFAPTLIVSSPWGARQIFHAHDKVFASRPSTSGIRLLYGGDNACFTSPCGADWHFTRKLYNTHLLGSRHMKEVHVPVISDEVRRLIEDLKASPPSVVLNVSACLSRITENIMFRIVLGERVSEVNSKLPPLESQEHHHHQHHHHHQLCELFHHGGIHLGAKFIGDAIPCLSFLDYFTRRRFLSWFSSVDTVLEAIVSNRVAARAADPKPSDEEYRPRDMLDVFLAASDPPLSRVKIKAMMLELFLAGMESTTTTLDWAMAEILANPRVLNKVQEEVDMVVGKERIVGMEDLPNLRYTKAVIKETLRKHTPGPLLLPRVSMEECELELVGDGSYKIPKGTTVLVNAWAIANDPATWDMPENFMPERFLEGGREKVFDVRGQHFELVPFGSGRRVCPGIVLALGIVELTVATLVQCFEWVVHDVVDMTERNGLSAPREAPLFASPTKFRLTQVVPAVQPKP